MTAPPAHPRRYRIRGSAPTRLEPTLYGRVIFGWFEARRRIARAWKRAALAVYEWIWP